jgi:hypothetical protein
MPRTQLNPQVVDLMFALLQEADGARDAVLLLADTIGVIRRLSTRLPSAQRVVLAERLRDSADALENHQREYANVP